MQDKETLFKKILPKVGWLAMNVFGNYVIQASFTYCSEALLNSVELEVFAFTFVFTSKYVLQLLFAYLSLIYLFLFLNLSYMVI